jgi:hypothetical protein
MVLRVNGGAVLARWDDNALGSQDTELLFFHLKTTTDTISIFYTNQWDDPSPKVIGSVRYIHNGNSSLQIESQLTQQIGPVILRIGRSFIDISFNDIEDVIEFGGGMFAVLEVAVHEGGYVAGGWGPNVDGYTVLGSLMPEGSQFNRDDFVVGRGVTIDGNSASSVFIRNTSDPLARATLDYLKNEFVGANAMAKNIPLDLVGLAQADWNAPGGDFDALINPAEHQAPEGLGFGEPNGDPNTLGEGVFGPNLVPDVIAYVGCYEGGCRGGSSLNFLPNFFV